MAQMIKYKGAMYQRVDTDLDTKKLKNAEKLEKIANDLEGECKGAEKALVSYLKDITGYKLATQKKDFITAFKIAEQIKDSRDRQIIESFLEKAKRFPEQTRRAGGLGTGEIS